MLTLQCPKRTPLVLLLGVAILVGFAETGASKEALFATRLRAVAGGAPKSNLPQFVRADKKGNVLLLRTATLEVFPLLPTGDWGKPTKLAESATLSRDLPILGAAANPHGDIWVIREGFGVRVFSGGKEKATIPPPAWAIAHVALLEDQPVVTVIPDYVGVHGKIQGSKPDPATAPAALVWNGKEWAPLLGPAEGSLEGLNPGQIREELTRLVFVGPAGTLWLAAEYAHRFEERTASGRLLTEIEVGDGKVRRRADAARLQSEADRIVIEIKREAKAGQETRVRSYASAAVRTTTALTEGRDGRMYFFVEEGAPAGGFRLERYDPATQGLEEMEVRFETAVSSIASLAAGKDGLYLAAYQPREGVFEIAWEALETAKWRPVPDVRVNGFTERESEARPQLR